MEPVVRNLCILRKQVNLVVVIIATVECLWFVENRSSVAHEGNVIVQLNFRYQYYVNTPHM